MLTISKNLETSRFEKSCKHANISSVLNTCACPCLKNTVKLSYATWVIFAHFFLKVKFMIQDRVCPV